MIEYKINLEEIVSCVANFPKGASVKDCAEYLKINRNVVAKYLDVLCASGVLEKRYVGKSKLFFVRERVPISQVLDFFEEGIVITNEEFRVLFLNSKVKKMFSHLGPLCEGEYIVNTLFFKSVFERIDEIKIQLTTNKTFEKIIEYDGKLMQVKVAQVFLPRYMKGYLFVINSVFDKPTFFNMEIDIEEHTIKLDLVNTVGGEMKTFSYKDVNFENFLTNLEINNVERKHVGEILEAQHTGTFNGEFKIEQHNILAYGLFQRRNNKLFFFGLAQNKN